MRNGLWFLLLAVSAAAAQHTVGLAWSDPDTGVTFNAYRGSGTCASNPTMTSIKVGIAVLNYTDPNVANGKFCYAVTAVDTSSGNESSYSNLADCQVKPHPPVLGAPVQLSKLGAISESNVEVTE